MSQFIKFNFTSSMLNIFRILMNTSILRSLRLFYCITILVVCSYFDVCCASFGVAGSGGIRVEG